MNNRYYIFHLMFAILWIFVGNINGVYAQELTFLNNIFKSVSGVYIGIGSDFLKSPPPTDSLNGLFTDGAGFDSEIILDLPDPAFSNVSFEVGIGASYRAASLSALDTSLVFQGGVRSFPSIRFRNVFPFGKKKQSELPVNYHELNDMSINHWFGEIMVNIDDLWNANVYDAENRRYSLKGQGIGAGLFIGTFIRMGRFTSVSRLGFRVSYFPGLNYGLPQGVNSIPSDWPKDAYRFGVEFTVGAQFGLSKPSPSNSTTYDGIWVLEKFDNSALPALSKNTREHKSFIKTEIVDGELTINTKDSSYTIILYSQESRLDSLGRIYDIRKDSTLIEDESGQAYMSNGKMVFDPKGSKIQAYPVIQKDGKLSIRSPYFYRRLLFKRI